MSTLSTTHCVITGASSGIGLAAVQCLLDDQVESLQGAIVHGVSRRAEQSEPLKVLRDSHPRRLLLHSADLCDDADLSALGQTISVHCRELRLVFNAAGILHHGSLRPEKSITQLDRQSIAQVFALNAFAPILLAQALLPLLRGRHRCTYASISARVGSIGDNRLGGWYSYRAAKAAQNQLLRTFAIELKRINPQGCCLLLHPGTVDTPLSAPFQNNVPSDRLFTPERAARQLLELAADAKASDSGRFLAYDGDEVPW